MYVCMYVESRHKNEIFITKYVEVLKSFWLAKYETLFIQYIPYLLNLTLYIATGCIRYS